MSMEVQSKKEALAARYNLPAQPEWQQFLNHFDLSENFALVVLLVADADGAELCRVGLEKELQQEGKNLVSIDIPSPDALRNLPSQLLAMQLPADAGGLWIAAVEPDYSPNFQACQEAWQFALARLNPRRNEIRRQFNCSIIFVGAPWLQETMREIAPDIWSVRTLVARIQPQAASETPAVATEKPTFSTGETEGGSDPLFALQEAEKLRGVPGKELALARLLHRAGMGFAARNDWRSAEKAYTEALKFKQQAGAPPESLISTFLNLSRTCHVLGQIQRSLHHAQLALTLARETGKRHSEEQALLHLGIAWLSFGEARKAIEFCEQALVIAREVGDRQGESVALGNLGNAYSLSGNARKAIEFYEQALAIGQEIGDRKGVGANLGNLGNAYKDLGETHKAIDFYEQALAIDREIGDRQGEGNAVGNLGSAYENLGEINKAIDFYEQALVIFREIGDRHGEGSTLGRLGNAFLLLDDARKAIEFHEQQLIIAREIGDRQGEGNGLWNSALALNKLGERTKAIARAEAALIIREAIGDPKAEKVRARLAEWRGQANPFWIKIG